MTGMVLSIDRCSLHDGPGLRTTVFLKGCPLSCLWCHNPESQSFKKELYTLDERCVNCGMCASVCKNHVFSNTGIYNETETSNLNIARSSGIDETSAMHVINRKDCTFCGKCVEICPQSVIEIKGMIISVDDVIKTVMKDIRYYEQSGGGMTISGGEPLAQYDFTLELLRTAKENGLHTCIETSGFSTKEKILGCLPHTDLFLFDYKETDDKKHKELIGCSNKLILENLAVLNKAGAKIILRCPIIPGQNDHDDHFKAIAEIADRSENISEINIMPYHPMGASKAKRIGREVPEHDRKFPTDEQITGWLEKINKMTDIPAIKG